MSVEVVPIGEEIEGNKLQEYLETRFRRAILLNLTLDEYLSNLNHSETGYNQELVEAVDVATTLIRHNTYSAFMDILDFGSTTLKKDSKDVLENYRKYRLGEVQNILVNSDSTDTHTALEKFIIDVQALNSEQILIKRWR